MLHTPRNAASSLHDFLFPLLIITPSSTSGLTQLLLGTSTAQAMGGSETLGTSSTSATATATKAVTGTAEVSPASLQPYAKGCYASNKNFFQCEPAPVPKAQGLANSNPAPTQAGSHKVVDGWFVACCDADLVLNKCAESVDFAQNCDKNGDYSLSYIKDPDKPAASGSSPSPAAAGTSMSAGAIAGAVVGSVLGAAIVAILAAALLWKRRKPAQQESYEKETALLSPDNPPSYSEPERNGLFATAKARGELMSCLICIPSTALRVMSDCARFSSFWSIYICADVVMWSGEKKGTLCHHRPEMVPRNYPKKMNHMSYLLVRCFPWSMRLLPPQSCRQSHLPISRPIHQRIRSHGHHDLRRWGMGRDNLEYELRLLYTVFNSIPESRGGLAVGYLFSLKSAFQWHMEGLIGVLDKNQISKKKKGIISPFSKKE